MDDTLDFIRSLQEDAGARIRCHCNEYDEISRNYNGRCIKPAVVFCLKTPRLQLCQKHYRNGDWTEDFLAGFRPLNGFYPCSIFIDGKMVPCAADSDFMWRVGASSLSFSCAQHMAKLKDYIGIETIRFR